MDRGRAAAALLALAACVACSSAAPTASDHTALDLHEGSTEGCYYNFQHYGEGDRIMTNEPCLNCTCHNRMLMCYLRVCPFTKAIGQDCTVEKRADQCCPIVTCPDVPVDLLTSTSTSSPAEYGPTGMGKLDKYGCSIDGKYFSEGSKVPPSPNKPCEHCYCIRNMTTCVMQECTLHVDGCTPIYHKDVCCPVRYSCDHTEDEIPLLDDMTTTVRPTPGFLLTTTTMMPVTQMTQDCIHDEQIFPDGASIKTDKACEHCYCMKGDIVCVVQECGTPMENEGKNCTSLPPREGQCCPDTYICEGDEPSLDITTEITDLTSAPPRRIEGSGYRNEPDEQYTERGPFENEVEGSGDISETDVPSKISPDPTDELLLSTTEKGVHLSQTTEADKGFNTIPDTIFENEPLVTIDQDLYAQSTESTRTEAKATIADELVPSQEAVTAKEEDENITTEGSSHAHEIDEIVPTDISKQEELSNTTIELSTMKDEFIENSVTETTEVKKETEQVPVSTESVALNDIPTTEKVAISVTEKDVSEEDISTVSKIDKDVEVTTNIVTSVTEQNEPNVEMSTLKEINIVKDITTISDIKEIPETTSVNPVDNEVDYIPARIPGEGDCLLNGITYGNNSAVPSTNNCHSSCRCVSSIIKCDPIICSPPPEYMENMNDCQTSYDTPDACCPTYICNAKETSLPQSHSQTSVTESSKPVVSVECNGDECSLNEEKQPSHNICESGNCESGSEQSGCGINGCQDQPLPSESPKDCSGEKCSVSPIIPCEGKNCEASAKPEEYLNEKTPIVLPNQPICSDEHGCKTTPAEEECNEESCRRKETSETETKVTEPCSDTDCKISDEQNIPVIEQTKAPSTDGIFIEKTTETIVSELVTQNILSSEKETISESSTELVSDLPLTKIEPSDMESSSAKTTDESTEGPVKSVTEIETNMSTNVDTEKQMDIPKEVSDKSDTTPIDIKPSLDDALDQESSTEKAIDNKPTIEDIEAVTESRLEDDIVVNKVDSPQEYTTEAVQISTQQSAIYEPTQEDSFTKLPTVMDDGSEQQVIKEPNEIEVRVTTEIEYEQSTTEKQEKVEILSQPTLIQDSVTTEVPESPITVSEIGDVSKLTTGSEADKTESIQYDNSEKIASPEVDITESPVPLKTEQQPAVIETVTSESSPFYDQEFTVKHDSYTELPQITITKSDMTVDSDSLQTISSEELDNKFKEYSTPSSVTKKSEQLATNADVIYPEGDNSDTKNQEYPSSTESEPLQHDDRNEGFNKEVTEKQITETEHETHSQMPQEATENTKLEISTETFMAPDMDPISDQELQTVSPFINKESATNLVKDVSATESSHYETSDSENENGDSELKTTPQDISASKDTSIIPVMTEESDKNSLKPSSPTSDEYATTENSQYSDVVKIEEQTTQLPKEITEEGYPTKDGDSQIPIETEDMKQQSVEHDIPEKPLEGGDEAISKITTTLLPFTKDVMYDVTSSQSPDSSPSDEVQVTPSSVSYEKEAAVTSISSTDEHISEKTENNLQELEPTTLNNIEISEIVTEKINIQPQEYATEQSKYEEGTNKRPSEDTNKEENDVDAPRKEYSTEIQINLEEYSTIALRENEVHISTSMPETDQSEGEKSEATVNPLVTESEEITEKVIMTDIVDQDSSTEISKKDILDDKNVPTSTEISDEAQTEYGMSLHTITEDKELENEELLTSVNYMSSTQSKVTSVIDSQYEKTTEISVTPKGEVPDEQKDEEPSTEEPIQSNKQEFENNYSIPDEYQTISPEHAQTDSPAPTTSASDQIHISHSMLDTEVESNVGTTEPVPLKVEDLPLHTDVPFKETNTVPGESQTVATKLETEEKVLTTESVPTEEEKLQTHLEMDLREGEEDASKVTKSPEIMEGESDKYPTTESLQSSSDINEGQLYTSKVPDLTSEEQSTSRTDTDSVTKLVVPESFETTEKQYITKADQEETTKISEYAEEHGTSQSDIESVTKLADTALSSTEKVDQEDGPKIPEVIEEHGTSQSDIESVTKLADTALSSTEKVDQEDGPKIPEVIEEQSTSRIDTVAPTEQKYSEASTTEKQYNQEAIYEIPEPNTEQGTSQTGIVISTEEDSKSYTTEKQYVTKTEKEETEKIPVFIEEPSTPRSDIESVTNLEESERATTEKQFVSEIDHKDSEVIEEHTTSVAEVVTQSEDSVSVTTEKQHATSAEKEIPMIEEENEKQITSQNDIELATKPEVSELDSVTTEKAYEDKLDHDEVSKSPEIIDEHGTSHFDIESVTKLEDNEAFTTEKQYVTKSDVEETPVIIQEQSTPPARIGSESENELEDSADSTTEKQDVTKIYIEDTPSDKLETNVSETDDVIDNEKTTALPILNIDTTVKSEIQGSDLHKPLEDVTEVSQKEESSTKSIPTVISVSTSVSEDVEVTTKLIMPDAVSEDNVENYSTERNIPVSSLPEMIVTVKESENKPVTEEEGTYSETTPYSVLLEEHTHSVQEDTSSDVVMEELPTTVKNEKQPERGDQIPDDTYDNNNEYGHSTEKQTEKDVQTDEKITSPDVETVTSADVVESSTIVEKVPSISDDQYEDKQYSTSVPEQKITTPIVLPTIKEEEHTTIPSISDKVFTTLRDIIFSSEMPEVTANPSKDDDNQGMLLSSTTKHHEDVTTPVPITEEKEKPYSSPVPSSSEMPETIDETHDEHSPDLSPSGPGGYGTEPDYVEEDQAFGPGTCRYGGKVYVSAQQIPRDDPCDFCFCFRSDIICLQQSCPPPIHGCHEEPIQGFCCPRYECPVSMATTVNVTTTTTTTTTTLPPHFLPHAYKGAAQRRGCQIKGHSYKVGEVVRASSGPCLHCTCGGDGQMKCDPKACTPEPMLRQMIAAAVSAKRRR